LDAGLGLLGVVAELDSSENQKICKVPVQKVKAGEERVEGEGNTHRLGSGFRV
jgi:hypothetical protein